jgi:hypothetical protein
MAPEWRWQRRSHETSRAVSAVMPRLPLMIVFTRTGFLGLTGSSRELADVSDSAEPAPRLRVSFPAQHPLG